MHELKSHSTYVRDQDMKERIKKSLGITYTTTVVVGNGVEDEQGTREKQNQTASKLLTRHVLELEIL